MPNDHKTFELANLNGINGFTINGIKAGDYSGHSCAFLDDINGDGIDDLIVGAYHANEGGQSYILFGRSGVWATYFELSTLNGANGVTIHGRAGSGSGVSVYSAGDINGDGTKDIVIGAHTVSGRHLPDIGQSYLLFGRSGIWPSVLELSTLDGVIGVRVNGVAKHDLSGRTVSLAGDVNGDGVTDVMIGAYNARPSDRAGQCYLIFGHTGAWPASLALSDLNGDNGVTFNGIQQGSSTGLSVSHVGDVNGDGIDDVIIGANRADVHGEKDTGQSYLVFGQNGAWPAVFELSSLNRTTGVMINGVAAGDQSGRNVAAAGDVNGDGINDVIIGAYLADVDDRIDSGQCYLVFGRASAWPESLELTMLDGNIGVVINGIATGDQTGIAVHSAGDLNGDGIDDVIIGAQNADAGDRSDAGQSYILFGDTGSWPASFELSALNGENGVMLNGIAASDYSGRFVGSAGDINHDGFADIIIGAYRADPNSTRIDAGQSYIIFGGPEQFSANQLAIQTSGSVRLNSSHLSVEPVVDSRVFTIEEIQHGHFELTGNPSVAVTQFTQQQINDGEIILYHDRSRLAPSYTVSAERVTRVFSDVKPQAAQITLLPSKTLPAFVRHQLLMNEGDTLTISPKMLLAENQDNTSVAFNVTIVTHGMFVDAQNTPLSAFTQQQVNEGAIRFVHDGSNEAPSYDLIATSGEWTTNAKPAEIIFTPINDAPVFINHRFVVHEGEALVITPDELRAWDEETPDDELMFIVHHVEHGEFRTKTINGPIGVFSQSSVAAGDISLVADNSGLPLAANISVFDGSQVAGPVAANMSLIPRSTTSKEAASAAPYIIGVVLVLAGVCFLGATVYLLLRCLGDSRLNKAYARPITDQGHSPKLLKQLSKALLAETNIRSFGHISASQAMVHLDAMKAILTELSTQKPDFDFDALTPTWQQIWLDALLRATQSTLSLKPKTRCHGRFFKAQITPEQICSAANGIAKRAIDDMTNTHSSNPTLIMHGEVEYALPFCEEVSNDSEGMSLKPMFQALNQGESYQALDGGQQLYAASQM